MEFNTKADKNVLVDAVCGLAILGDDVALALGSDVVMVDDLVRRFQVGIDTEQWEAYIWDGGYIRDVRKGNLCGVTTVTTPVDSWV